MPAAVPSFRPTPTAATTHFAASKATGEGPGDTHKPPGFSPTVGRLTPSKAGQSPLTSRSVKTLSGKLGNDNHRLLGTRNSSGPSTKFLEPSLSVSSPPRGFSLRRKLITHQIRDSRHAGKGSNSHGSLHLGGESQVHQLTLFGPQKRRWSEASGERETPEPVEGPTGKRA